MEHKKKVTIFILIVVVTLIGLEAFYMLNPIATNTTDARRIQIDSLKNTKIDYAIFGSSVTNGVLGSNPHSIKGVFSGATAAQTTLYGQYFLSQELYKKNRKIEKIYLSFVPHMLAFDVISQDNKRVRRIFNNVFKEKKFVDFLKNVDKNYNIEYKDYFIQRRIYFDKFFQGKTRKIFFGEHTTLNGLDFIENSCDSVP